MTRRVLEEAGLDASCSLGLDFDTDVSSADPAVSARGEELLERAIDVTSAIGANFLGGVVTAQWASTWFPRASVGDGTASGHSAGSQHGPSGQA
jgi:D-psicose/D-tagatose/L-ribulose 3-epimerase